FINPPGSSSLRRAGNWCLTPISSKRVSDTIFQEIGVRHHFSGSGQMRRDERLELGLADRADLRRDELPVTEQHQRRDAAHAVAARDSRVLVRVELRDLEPPRVLAG